MNYELCKKLKDAGYPQKGYWFWSVDETDMPRITTEANVYDTCSFVKSADGKSYEKIKLCFAPTLSELIEACGDKFHKLEMNNDSAYPNSPHKWSAFEFRMSDEWKAGEFQYVSGSTPEEAVANLYLRLKNNKK